MLRNRDPVITEVEGDIEDRKRGQVRNRGQDTPKFDVSVQLESEVVEQIREVVDTHVRVIGVSVVVVKPYRPDRRIGDVDRTCSYDVRIDHLGELQLRRVVRSTNVPVSAGGP